MNKATPEDVNMQPVGFRIMRILTDYAQKLPGYWSTNVCLVTTLDSKPCHLLLKYRHPIKEDLTFLNSLATFHETI